LIEQVSGFKRPRIDSWRAWADVIAIEDVEYFREHRDPRFALRERAIEPQIEARVRGNP
jgi:hypothetical protein